MGWGDELMALGEAQALAKEKGGKVRILDASNKPRWHIAWDNAPEVARPGEKAVDEIVNGPNRRGYFFGVDSKRWRWKPYSPIPAKLYFNAAEKAFAESLKPGFIVIEPHVKAKAEAVNRSWGFGRFQEVINLAPELDWVQMGGSGTVLLKGVRVIETPGPRMMAAAMSRAGAYVGPEGGMHHTAAAFGVPGVVIFGHFNSPLITGYDVHRSLFTKDGLGCGSRVPCLKCQAAMAAITPEQVVAELLAIASDLAIGHNKPI